MPVLPSVPTHRPPPLPGERAFVGRIGVVAGTLGTLAELSLWASAPGEVVAPGLFAAVVVATVLVVAGCLTTPFERLPQPLIQAPVGAGIVLCALACWNTGGADSPLSVFYLLIMFVLAYAGTLPQVLGWGAVMLAAQLLPFLYDDGATVASLAAGGAVRGVSALALAVAVQRLRHRIRTGAAAQRVAALRDALTGVASEEGLLERLGAEVARARRHDTALAVVEVSVAHGGEEEVSARRLHSSAAAIAGTLRGEDLVARTGERSFTVVLPGADGAQARRVAARILAALERLGGWGDHGCRAAVAEYPHDGAGAIELCDAARAAARDAGRRVSLLSPDEPGVAAASDVPWPSGHAVRVAAALAGAVLLGWFALPLVVPADVARPATALAALVFGAVQLGLTARHVRGRERRGWALVLLGLLVALPPCGGAPGMLLIATGLMVAAGRGWTRDRVRMLDAGIIVANVAALIYGLVVLPALRADRLEGWGIVAGVGGALGTAMGITGAFLVAVTIMPRRRPDIWLVLAGAALAALAPVPYALHSGGRMTLVEAWEVIVPLALMPAVAACLLRRRMPRRSLQVDTPEANPDPALWLGTVLLFCVIVATTAVHGAILPIVAGLLAVTVLLRGLRFHLVQRQRRLYASEARRSNAVRAAQQRASLEALARALEARDGYTGRHGEETVEIAVRVARALGLEEAEVEEVRTVALLHDIGKIGIPNEILHKPGPLDAEEWERMREHPVIGERILRVVPGLERVARAVRHEHERWDGGGYPDGIAGEDIPLASRITLVCDAWHAMTSDRPYRRGMPADDAVAQLVEHSGTQFDRAVVRALLQVLSADGVSPAGVAYQAAA